MACTGFRNYPSFLLYQECKLVFLWMSFGKFSAHSLADGNGRLVAISLSLLYAGLTGFSVSVVREFSAVVSLGVRLA